jgi:hypothetical protein
MMVTQSQLFDVPTALSTIVTIREGNTYARSLYFKNQSSGTLAIQIEHSSDGGATWALVGTAFSLATGVIVVKEVAATYANILRIRSSGGGDDRDLFIAYARMFDDGATWTDPTL